MRLAQPLLVLLVLPVPVVALLGCSSDDSNPDAMPSRWTVHVAPDAPEGVRIAADDAVRYLGDMGLEVERVDGTDLPECRAGQGAAVVLGEGLGALSFNPRASNEQTWRVAETRCEGGAVVQLSGAGLLGRQYAVYEWLHRIGVRFFHPEETFVPAAPRWPETPLERTHTPAFHWRSVSLHLTHPLELGDAFRLGEEAHYREAARYIDWQLRNGASNGHAGVGDGELADYGLRRGFPRETGFSLHNAQQGGRPIVDPDDPRTDEEQIEEAIVERMGDDPARYPELFSFTFNPSEFTEIDDEIALGHLTFIADYFAEHYPETILLATNHGTAGEPTATHGVRYYDLPMLAPPNLGVKVHTLMFYDLFRPAPVYGNESFQYLYDFMVSEYRTRRLWHFPESAWWLTFDNAVPLYLPITVEARDRDIQGIAFMLDGKLDGHRVFGSGHEWGYWQNEYCSFRMAADLDYRWRDCFADIATVAGDAAPVLERVLEETVWMQERDIVWGGLMRYLVGTDEETEVAASVGVVFHELPPAPQEILRWDAERVADWNRRVLPGLQRAEADYADLVARLNAVRDQVPEAGLSFFDEIRDGLEVNGLRARHAWQVYGALVTLRDSQLRFDATLAERAQEWLDDAKRSTEAAVEVIHRRESGYRYAPLDRAIAGGPDGTGDDNWTIYDYRYLNRAHHGFYYRRTDQLAEDAFAGSGEVVGVDDALLAPDERLALRVMDDGIGAVDVAWGDGTSERGGPLLEHAYPTADVYQVMVSAERDGSPFAWEAEVASLVAEHRTGFTGVLVEPAGVELIEPVMPGLVFGPVDDSRVAFGFSTVPEGTVRPELWNVHTAVAGSTALVETQPARVRVPIINRATGGVTTSIVVEDATLTVVDSASPVVLSGDLSTDAVIQAVVAIGGFDEAGARSVVASTLGYTPETLPPYVSFTAEYALE